MSDSFPCSHCSAQVNWDAVVCPECRISLGVPNQRELLAQEEKEALQARYQQARQNAQSLNNTEQLKQLELSVKQHSKAVINVAPEFLLVFLQNENNLLSNYNLQTTGETRLVAKMQNDRQRRGTEGFLFGVYAPHIRYAALSLENRGLVSYGECSVILKNASVQDKATVLEENSYYFLKKNTEHIVVEEKGIPKGYRAIWAERHLLAVAKLAPKMDGVAVKLAELLLKSNGKRADDEFMEVHIYGVLSWQSIAAIAVSEQDCEEAADFRRICNRANKLSIECIV